MKNFHKYAKFLVLAVCILLAYKLLFDFAEVAGWIGRIVGIVSPFIIGFVIAFCINIPVSWLELKIRRIKFKWVKKIARSASVLINIGIIVLMIIVGLSLIIPMVYENAEQLADLLPGYYKQTLDYFEGLAITEQLGLTERIRELRGAEFDLSGIFDSSNFNITDTLNVAQGVFSGLFTTILAIVSTIYFLLEYNRIRDFFKRLIGVMGTEKKRDNALKYVRLVDVSFRKFISSQVLDCLILGTITMIEFTILGSSYAIVLGIMLGVLNIIPYFGSIFGSVLASLIMLFDRGLETAIITAVILLITQQIDGNFINPKIMGTSFKISPVLVVIAITIGGAVGGVAGMLLAIPIVNVLKTILEEIVANREEQLKAAKPVEVPPVTD